ncbi:MAG: hypothetical protein A4S09_05160 [Proteobacteria bacterium SG_bin7]|nr:MAG: hypothetical protein A4S09_05160 [Proteobacteria bacterium SG_bin7]
MTPNITRFDRILRWILGTLFLGYAFAGGPPWAYFSIYFIVTSVFGICPVYLTFRRKKMSR